MNRSGVPLNPVPVHEAMRGADGKAANPCTHLANAHRLRQRFGGRMIHVQGDGWYCYDPLRPPWRRSDEAAMQYAQRLGAIVAAEAAAKANCKGGASDPGYKELCKWAVTCEQDHCMRASLAQAAALPGMYCTADTMDADPYLLGTPNEVIDLRTGTARAHRPEDFMSRTTSVALDAEISGVRWRRFVDYICHDNAELTDCLQVSCGYASTGLTIEQRMLVPWGTGKNGKTTFMNAVSDALGDYACAAPPNLLVQHRGEHHPTELMELRGRRMVIATESDQHARLNEPAVKQMTGSDPMKGRAMRQDFVEWNPTHKLFLVTNHKPVITGTDEGIWRRITLLPFTATITDEMCKRSREFLKELEQDRPAILQWLVDGARRYFEAGLVLPATVIAATAQYRSDSDVLGDFLAERCELGQGLVTTAADVRRGYAEWCQDNGEKPLGSRSLSTALAERGFGRDRASGGVRVWTGLKLKAQPAEPVTPVTQVTQNTPNSSYRKLHDSYKAQTGTDTGCVTRVTTAGKPNGMNGSHRDPADCDNRIAALIAEWTTGDEVDGLDLVAAAECEGLSVAAVWSTLERKGWRVADDGIYRQPLPSNGGRP